MAQLFKNNTTGTLAAQLNAGATTCTLNAGHNFTDPGADYYLATLIGVTGTTETSWEIVRVTNVATNTLTITRAQESTADATWPAGTRIEARVTAASTESKANLGTAAYAATGDFAPSAKGVTNGDSHDHSGGDGAQIAYSSLSGTPTLGTAAAAATGDFAAASHAHGNITSAGAIGSTANLPVITTTSGVLTAGAFGTGATNFCAGNDARLSDARTPTAHNQAETTITFTDVTTGNASTSAHGFAPKATAPASGLRSVMAIDNGETIRSDKALFDATNPAALGSASPGSAMTAARRDHVHALPAGLVTNGDSHDHNGGDGAQIAYGNLSGLPTLPSGAIVGTTDTQTLTNKTLDGVTLNNGFKEEIGTSVQAKLNTANGSIQKFTLTASLDWTGDDELAAGESVLVMVKTTASYTLTLPTLVWVGGTAPTLSTTDFNCLELWKVGNTLYAAWLGTVAS